MPELHSIIVQEDGVIVPDLPGRAGYEWLSETILDGKVPVWVPCGFQLNPIKGNIAMHKSVAAMNNSFLETPLALIAKMRNVIFTGIDTKNNIVHMAPYRYEAPGLTGPCYWSTVPLFQQGRPGDHVTVLAQEDYFCTILKGATVRFYVCMDTGYHTMAENHARLKMFSDAKDYTAIASEHTLNNYVSVCYYEGKGPIRVLYHQGMTPQLFQTIWKEAERFGNVTSAKV